MRKPLEDMRIFSERRQKIAESLSGGALLLVSPPKTVRNGSVVHPFRQDSNLYYLTGFEEPGAIFLLRPGCSPETVMFVRRKDPDRETWDGFRFGPEKVQSEFHLEKAYVLEDFSTEIVELLKGVDRLYYKLFRNSEMDGLIRKALLTLKFSQKRTGFGLLPIFDSDELLGEFRLIKSDSDISILRKACEISTTAHINLMKYIKPGLSERELHGYFTYQIMKEGASREGYGGIFAGGANACTLHYVFNDQVLDEKDLLLVDAAGEYNYFTSDITRTYPVSGRFSKPQGEVYAGVLNIQRTLIESIKPGISFQQLHETAASLLTDLMLDLGLLSGRKDDILKSGQHKKYYPHGVGHFLGMDVHDVGLYFNKKTGESRQIEPGMTFTIEPGLYIPAHDEAAAPEYRGIGVRIEDNILVTTHGYEVLTKDCPKQIGDLESLIGSKTPV